MVRPRSIPPMSGLALAFWYPVCISCFTFSLSTLFIHIVKFIFQFSLVYHAEIVSTRLGLNRIFSIKQCVIPKYVEKIEKVEKSKL